MNDPLTDGIESKKKPIILYIIIGVLFLTVIIETIIIIVSSGGDPEPKKETEPKNPVEKEHLIEIIESFYKNDSEDGSYSYHGSGNHLNSEYYKIIDVYNMVSTNSRAILSKFKTYQQTSEFSSPCALIIMILTYYNKIVPGERTCMIDFDIDIEGKCAKGTYNREHVFEKINPKIFANKLKTKYNLEVLSNVDFDKDSMPFKDEIQFGSWVKKNIQEGNIIIVLYNDWAGQYSAIIGIDDMGTEDINDDILILADAYDTTDHLQDGYTILSMERFYHLWQYSYISYYKNDESMNHGQFILIKKPKNN